MPGNIPVPVSKYKEKQDEYGKAVNETGSQNKGG
jgi:hypothetical protein